MLHHTPFLDCSYPQVVHNVPMAMTPSELVRLVLNSVPPAISHLMVSLPQPNVLKVIFTVIIYCLPFYF
jgi:hypothetical protein